MGLMANLPFALSAGMGINAFLAYTVVGSYGYSWQVGLLAVFIEGIAFGMISYVIMNIFAGKAKKLNPVMYVLFILFILKYIFL